MIKIKNLFIVLIGWTLVLALISYLGLTFFPIVGNSEKLSFFQKLTNWDGGAYIGIAERGYENLSEFYYAFFPFYPIVIKIVSYLMFGNYLLSALIISWVSLLFALFFLYKLVRLDFNKNIAEKTIMYILVFPFSFFFVASYTESLCFFLTVSALYFFRKSSHTTSSILGMFATATRVTGIALFPALVFEAIKSGKKSLNKKILSLALVPLGVISYMTYLFINKGNAFYFIEAVNVYWERNQMTYPFKVLLAYVKNYFSHPGNVFASRDSAIIALEFIFSVIFFVLIILVWFRVRKSYAIYAFIAWSFPLMTGRTGSMLRYVLILFPCFIALGYLGNKYKNFDKLYLLLSVMLLALFLVSFINGYWVA